MILIKEYPYNTCHEQFNKLKKHILLFRKLIKKSGISMFSKLRFIVQRQKKGK